MPQRDDEGESRHACEVVVAYFLDKSYLLKGVADLAFSDRTIEEIKGRLSIVDVVSSYTQVIRRSGGYWIRCPFHGNGSERTPSCKLDDKNSRFYCFGCHEHGSMFDFVMKMERLSFPEAVRELAAKAGVQIEDESPRESHEREKRTNLYELNEKMASVFHDLLMKSPEAQEARDYLARRKVAQSTIERFRLGYVPRDVDWLHDYMRKEGLDDDFLRTSGYFSQNRYPYPLFCNRLMFPVRSWQGRTVAFGARDLSFREGAPKYINTPETAVYQKKNNLYGFYEGLDEIRKAGYAIVCEGNFDAISLQQAGLGMAVAPFGTAFTSEQASLIKRYADGVRLLFDTDEAGQNATVKAILLCQEKGLECSVLSLDRHKDASEYLEAEGAEALKTTLAVSTDAFSYLVKKGLNTYNNRTPKGKSELVGFLRPFLNATGSNVEREAYIRQLSQLIDVGEAQIAGDLAAGGMMAYSPSGDDAGRREGSGGLRVSAISADLYLMLMFANHRELFASYTKVLRFGDLKDRQAQMIYLALESMRRDGVGKSDELFLSLIADEQLRNDVATSFELPQFTVGEPRKVIDELLDRIALRKLEDGRRLVLRQIRQSESEGLEEAQLKELLQEKVSLDGQISALMEKLQNA